jgi:hypothetical protein
MKTRMSDQAWAFLFVITGCLMALLCRHFGITETLGATIVGGGLNALTKAETNRQTVNVDHVDKVSQLSEAPAKDVV